MKYYLYFCLYLCYQAIGCTSDIVTLQSKLSSSFSRYKDKDYVKACTVFGFKGAVGAKLFHNIFRQSNDIDKIVPIIVENNEEMLFLGGRKLVVGYFDDDSLSKDLTLNYIQSYADSIALNKVPSELILLVGTSDNDKLRKTKIEIDAVLNDLKETSLSNQVQYISALVSESEVAPLSAKLRTCINNSCEKEQVKQLRNKSIKLMSGMKRGIHIMPSQSSVAKTTSGVVACQDIAEEFTTALKASVDELMNKLSERMSEDMKANDTLEIISSILEDTRDVVQRVNAQHFTDYSAVFNVCYIGNNTSNINNTTTNTSDKYSDAIKAAAYRARLQLAAIVLPIYRTVAIPLLLEGTKSSYDDQLLQLPPMIKLPALVSQLGKETMHSFIDNMNILRSEFLDTVVNYHPSLQSINTTTGSTATGLLGVDSSTCSWFPKSSIIISSSSSAHRNYQQLTQQYDYALEKLQLSDYIEQRGAERISELFLAGTYNAYVKESNSKMPPTHISVNYLVNPSTWWLKSEYNKLYDDHKIGTCTSRADPLIFKDKGVAAIPFDPNSHPVSSKVVDRADMSWWKQITTAFG